MTSNKIQRLIEIAHAAPAFNDFLRDISMEMDVIEAEKAIYLEFGMLEEFFQWVKDNVTGENIASVTIKGAMPGRPAGSEKRSTLQAGAKKEEIRRECDELRKDIAFSLSEIQELLRTEIPHLKALYVVKLGVLECDLFALKCENMKRRKRIGLVAAARSQGVPPDLEEIERLLETEQKEWKEKVEEKRREIEGAQRHVSQAQMRSDREQGHFKALFALLVERLHPELNPLQGSDDRALWLRLQDAYEKGGLAGLQEMADLASHIVPSPFLPEQSGMVQWEECRSWLKKWRVDLNHEIEALQREFPLAIRESLQNERWIEEKNMITRMAIEEEKEMGDS
jgi:hypothetical protein